MSSPVKIIFEGQEEILSVIKNHESIVKALGYPSEKCALIGSEIELRQELGSGKQATIFAISFPGSGAREYVVKRAEFRLEIKPVLIDKITEKRWEWLRPFQSERVKQAYAEKEKHKGRSIKLIIPPQSCKTLVDSTFPAIPVNVLDDGSIEKINVPKGSYLCEQNEFSEYVNSVYVGQLYREYKCINFFNTFSTFICNVEGGHPNEFYQYTFMDRIDGDLLDCEKCLRLDSFSIGNEENVINGIYIQTLFAISAYQEKWKMSHNDLHSKNVFIEYVRPDKPMTFNNQLINDADFYHYHISETKFQPQRGPISGTGSADNYDIYFPAIDVIVKIGDFGLSVKYSEPIVGDLGVFTNGYDTHDGNGPWIPNQFFPSYDSTLFTVHYASYIDGNLNRKKLGTLMSECIPFIFTESEKWQNVENLIEPLLAENLIKDQSRRPTLEKLSDMKNSKDILLGPILKRYGERPKNGKIVTLGIF